VLADPFLASVHQCRDLLGVGVAFGVGDGGDLLGPGRCRQRNQGAGTPADAGVDDGGDVAGAGQVSLADRVGQDLAGVQAGQFRRAQCPP
jgi:hypothetical protein